MTEELRNEVARTILPAMDQLAAAVNRDGPYSEAGSALQAADAILPMLEAATAERDRAKSACRTLGEVVERHVTDTLRWAGMEDQIGLDDPDQQLAWERCAEMPGTIAGLTADRDRLKAAIQEALRIDTHYMHPQARERLTASLNEGKNDDQG